MFNAAIAVKPEAAREIAHRVEGKVRQRIDLPHTQDEFAGKTTEEL